MNLHTPAATKVVGAVSLLLVAALGWVLLVSPAWSAIGEADQGRSDAADANVLLTGQLTDLQAQAGDLTRTTESAADLATIFPTTADQPGFFAAVTEAAARAGIDASAINALSPSVPTLVADPAAEGDPAAGTTGAPAEAATDTTTDPTADPATDPTTPVDPSSLAVQTVSMSVTAEYDELKDLLANLETMPRALLVSGVTLTEGEDGALAMTLEGATFVAPPLVEPDLATGAAGSAGATGAVDASETGSTDADPSATSADGRG